MHPQKDLASEEGFKQSFGLILNLLLAGKSIQKEQINILRNVATYLSKKTLTKCVSEAFSVHFEKRNAKKEVI